MHAGAFLGMMGAPPEGAIAAHMLGRFSMTIDCPSAATRFTLRSRLHRGAIALRF